jgi:hypothetical protein
MPPFPPPPKKKEAYPLPNRCMTLLLHGITYNTVNFNEIWGNIISDTLSICSAVNFTQIQFTSPIHQYQNSTQELAHTHTHTFLIFLEHEPSSDRVLPRHFKFTHHCNQFPVVTEHEDTINCLSTLSWPYSVQMTSSQFTFPHKYEE